MKERGSLARQLFNAQLLVVSAMAATVVLVAAVIGPPTAERHMRLAGHGGQPEVLDHAEEAFRSGLFTSLGVGVAIAVVGATVVNIVLIRRLGSAVTVLRRGAERVADGDYSTPIVVADDAHELGTVAQSLNALAAQVGASESTRRRMLTDLSHEIRTPVATLSAIVEALEDGVAEPTLETLGLLRHQCTRLHRLAVDMRDVSAFEDGRLPIEPQRHRLTEVLDAAVEAARPQCRSAGISLELAPVPESWVFVDGERIGQVLDNLLSNAQQHAVSAVRVVSDIEEGWVRIDVSDDGFGIPDEQLPHIFERFFRGGGQRRRDEGGGTGVGLTISRAIAHAHGGRLDAANTDEGRGATLTLRLPAAS